MHGRGGVPCDGAEDEEAAGDDRPRGRRGGTRAARREAGVRDDAGTHAPGDGAVLVSPDGTHAFLGLRAADRVAVINLETLEVTAEIAMGAGAGPGCLFWLGSN